MLSAFTAQKYESHEQVGINVTGGSSWFPGYFAQFFNDKGTAHFDNYL